MSKVNALEVCRTSLFEQEDSLREKWPADVVDKVLRCRQMYLWLISAPESKDKDFVREHQQRFNLSRVTAYADLKIVKAVLPGLSEATSEFHLWRYNEMILETYRKAKARNDIRTMERAATSYAKFNRVDAVPEKNFPIEEIAVQPFVPTMDPSVLGIKPIPNLNEKIKSMLDKYGAESADIYDVEYEQVDIDTNAIDNTDD